MTERPDIEAIRKDAECGHPREGPIAFFKKRFGALLTRTGDGRYPVVVSWALDLRQKTLALVEYVRRLEAAIAAMPAPRHRTDCPRAPHATCGLQGDRWVCWRGSSAACQAISCSCGCDEARALQQEIKRKRP